MGGPERCSNRVVSGLAWKRLIRLARDKRSSLVAWSIKAATTLSIMTTSITETESGTQHNIMLNAIDA
jgi:hypothetical protein